MGVAAPDDTVPRYRVESVTIPFAARAFIGNDEPSLLQTLVRLRIIESHLSLFSPRRAMLRQLEHIQNAVKHRRTEIDALFLGIEQSGPTTHREFVVTLEAKRKNEDFNLDQIRSQPAAVFQKMRAHHIVVPIAAKAIAPSVIHVVEFAAIERGAEEDASLVMVSQAVYELYPPLPGIGR